MAGFEDPFARYGYPPELLDVTVHALKRGRNGEGLPPIELTLGGEPTGRTIIDGSDRDVISALVNNAVGPEAARSVGYGVLGVIKSSYHRGIPF